MAALTIPEIKDRKKELDEAILSLVSGFEDETGLRVSYVSLNREEDRVPYSESEYSKLPLKAVSAEVNLDLLL